MSTTHPTQMLFFDTFGTVVEWRICVTRELNTAVLQAVKSPRKGLSANVRDRAAAMTSHDWLAFAEQWRQSYGDFTATFDPSTEFVSVDQHHFNALQDLLQKHGLDGLLTDEERWELAFSWHRLDPWPDSVPGLAQLNKKFQTSTLSNGNVSLLQDLQRHGSLPFTHLTSSENFSAYKPSPLVYKGAAQKFDLQSGQCGMVAAHLTDLKGAKSCGLQTIYVEREFEETCSPEEIAQAKAEGWVDMWIDIKSDGFLEVARRFGIE
ncbi:hypothetical protein PENANT_c001G01534 [Penicillium antarcticum]|uniref:Haloacid dehalogenase, type II n=1 Tax=Penicillium antarcticum TaxID=416450 RepID=A0A1V6QP27_9EURO|nr:uncharacterized protein N7508_010039 [Penicillium antarcticum]KAJ5295218.1 hypothetical protein N7508_010039 [Penicillium antarcticum]OQD90737.1 hypothetical protein PENANT_c001G01534 [Penicillium antarcticum]